MKTLTNHAKNSMIKDIAIGHWSIIDRNLSNVIRKTLAEDKTSLSYQTQIKTLVIIQNIQII